MRLHSLLAATSTFSSMVTIVTSFSPISIQYKQQKYPQRLHASASAPTTTETSSFIATELRGAAMKLHTRAQAPKEGEATEAPKPKQPSEPYVPTHLDYLKFLVDSQYVYKCFEEVIADVDADYHDDLAPFMNTGLERTDRLQVDIDYISSTYNVEVPPVGKRGLDYGDLITSIVNGKDGNANSESDSDSDSNVSGKERIPEFMCHYYNYYFAHTAGGRMIGKQMAALLLEKKTLEFYKWDGDLNEIKEKVKSSIEEMAASWSREQKDQCVDATAAAFMGGGGINAYLSGGRGGHH